MPGETTLAGLLAGGLAHAGHLAALDGTVAALFLAGLIGGATHCVGMCGPFVLAQAGERLRAVPAAKLGGIRRLQGAALLPYHLGRMTTYAGLGALVAAFAQQIGAIAALRWLSAALLLAAAMLFATQALRRFGVPLPGLPTPAASGRWSALVGRLALPIFASPTGLRGYLLGIILGFLACGPLYGAMTAAASTMDPGAGALSMAAFALGTTPIAALPPRERQLVLVALVEGFSLSGTARLLGVSRKEVFELFDDSCLEVQTAVSRSRRRWPTSVQADVGAASGKRPSATARQCHTCGLGCLCH